MQSNLPVAIRGLPIVREPDGLAMSSRNRYLAPDERRVATVLWRALRRGREAVAAGERDADRVRQILAETISSEELAKLDYAQVVEADSLEPLERITPEHPAVALVAARIGATRLIDNAYLTE